MPHVRPSVREVWYVHTMPRQRSAEPRYRRRVVLELTPDESTILDSLANRHGTLRGAVLAGLRELEANRSAELEAQANELQERLERAEHSGQADRDQAAADGTHARAGPNQAAARRSTRGDDVDQPADRHAA